MKKLLLGMFLVLNMLSFGKDFILTKETTFGEFFQYCTVDIQKDKKVIMEINSAMTEIGVENYDLFSSILREEGAQLGQKSMYLLMSGQESINLTEKMIESVRISKQKILYEY